MPALLIRNSDMEDCRAGMIYPLMQPGTNEPEQLLLLDSLLDCSGKHRQEWRSADNT